MFVKLSPWEKLLIKKKANYLICWVFFFFFFLSYYKTPKLLLTLSNDAEEKIHDDSKLLKIRLQ